MKDFFDEVLNQDFPEGSIGAMMRRHCHDLVEVPSEVPIEPISSNELVADNKVTLHGDSYREERDPTTLMSGRICRGTDCE